MCARTLARRDERGIALIWALIVMMLVAGIIALVGLQTVSSSENAKRSTSRVRSGIWVQAAADDIAARLNTREIGFDVGASTPPLTSTDLDLVVPTTGSSALATSSPVFDNSGNGLARKLTVDDGTTKRIAWYQVLAMAETGTPAWNVRFIRGPGLGAGSVQAVLRVWENSPNARPVTARITYRQSSLSRFSILSDDVLNIKNLGTVTPTGYIHANNSSNQSTAITVGNQSQLLNASAVTSSQGSITGCSLALCKSNVKDVVDFGAATRTMQQIRSLSTKTLPDGTTTYAAAGIARTFETSALSAGGDRVTPGWLVLLQGPGCSAGQLTVWTVDFRLRNDIGGIPAIDDRALYIGPKTTECVTVNEGGGAFLFESDVDVHGVRPAGAPPVTIVTQRDNEARPAIRLDTDNVPSTLETTSMTTPASILLDGGGGGVGGPCTSPNVNGAVGAANPLNPVGLVAEGSIYVPTYEMNHFSNDGKCLTVQNVAGLSLTGGLTYGPYIDSIASDGTNNVVGFTPAFARNTGGAGYGERFTWKGSIASRREVLMRYGTGADYVGYGDRSFESVPSLLWNPPPFYPGDRGWYTVDFQELANVG